MPYLNYTLKKALDKGKVPETPGDLTYLLSKELIKATDTGAGYLPSDYYQHVQKYIGDSPNFAVYAEVLGAIQATIFEYKRRKGLLQKWQQEELNKLNQLAITLYVFEVGPYEDAKIVENGDIYGTS